MEKTTLEIGDKILIENWMSKRIVTITRVTKTKAVAHVVRKDGSSYDYTFNRNCHHGYVEPKPRIDSFDMTKRILINSKKLG